MMAEGYFHCLSCCHVEYVFLACYILILIFALHLYFSRELDACLWRWVCELLGSWLYFILPQFRALALGLMLWRDCTGQACAVVLTVEIDVLRTKARGTTEVRGMPLAAWIMLSVFPFTSHMNEAVRRA